MAGGQGQDTPLATACLAPRLLRPHMAVGSPTSSTTPYCVRMLTPSSRILPVPHTTLACLPMSSAGAPSTRADRMPVHLQAAPASPHPLVATRQTLPGRLPCAGPSARHWGYEDKHSRSPRGEGQERTRGHLQEGEPPVQTSGAPAGSESGCAPRPALQQKLESWRRTKAGFPSYPAFQGHLIAMCVLHVPASRPSPVSNSLPLPGCRSGHRLSEAHSGTTVGGLRADGARARRAPRRAHSAQEPSRHPAGSRTEGCTGLRRPGLGPRTAGDSHSVLSVSCSLGCDPPTLPHLFSTEK